MDINRLDDDTLEEIFSRLPVKDIALNKCVSKRWQMIMSQFSFVRRYASKSTGISGLFLQQLECKVLPIETECLQMQESVLNFIPEAVSIVSSNNGLLCCRSFLSLDVRVPDLSDLRLVRDVSLRISRKEPKLYICNPTSKEFIAINLTDKGLGIHTGLAFNSVDRSFELTSIHCQQKLAMSFFFTFSLFSSKTWNWRSSKDGFHWDSTIHKDKQIFVSGRFHWLTFNHHLITFDLKNEAPGILMMPGPVMSCEGRRTCLGSTEGHLNYVVVHPSEIRIWVLKSYEKPEWLLVDKINLLQLCGQRMHIFSPDLLLLLQEQRHNEETKTNTLVLPMAYNEGILFMDMNWSLLSFNVKTNVLKNHCSTNRVWNDLYICVTVVPYSVNLAAVNALKGIGACSSGSATDPS